MRQNTTKEQTAKLIELGFERPENGVIKQLLDRSTGLWVTIGEEGDYYIGELIEKLPMENRAGERSIVYDGLEWVVNWDNDDGTINQVVATELIDALYEMILRLKEEEVI